MISEAMMSWPCDQREEPAPQSSMCSVLCAIIFVQCCVLCSVCCVLCVLCCLLCALCCVLCAKIFVQAICCVLFAALRLCASRVQAVCCVLFAVFRLCTSCVQAVCRPSTIWLEQQPVITSHSFHIAHHANFARLTRVGG